MGKPSFGTVQLGACQCVIQVTYCSVLTLLWKVIDASSDGERNDMEPEQSELFQDLVARTLRTLEGQGLSVVPSAVASIIEVLAASAALRAGVSTDDALCLVEPEQIAELIARANSDERHISVRPVREDRAHANIASTAAGQLINALSQTAKMAVTNGDSETALHAADLLSEFGFGISGAVLPARVGTERGVLAETAQILDRAAEAFEGGEWTTCPCGQDHGQQSADQALPKVFRADAEMARQLLVGDLARGE